MSILSGDDIQRMLRADGLTRGLGLSIDHSDSWLTVTMTLDGSATELGYSLDGLLADAELLQMCAADVQELLAYDDGMQWPTCPAHPDHMVLPEVSDGVASWVCQRTGLAWAIGSLRRPPTRSR